MSADLAIRVEHVSKKYCKSIKKSMAYGVNDIVRNSLGLSSHSERLRKDEFWAVDDISFDLKLGETLGIIGKNGSGKTTLLKLLNGIFWPDKGKITVRGRVGTLINVGAGFHPLLTGHQNIYINAAILGMTKQEADKNFESIIDFADIGEFMKTPIKYYSSGMLVRLGFAIAVHCNPDVLLIDEILAVGDIDFQNKCFNRIGELMSKGTTTVLVSHNMVSIQRTCGRCIWIDKGKIKAIGDALEVTDAYQRKTKEELDEASNGKEKEDGMQIMTVEFSDREGNKRNTFNSEEPVSIDILVLPKENIINPKFDIKLKSSSGIIILHLVEDIEASFFPNEAKVVRFCMDQIPLSEDIVHMHIAFWDNKNTKMLARKTWIFHFKISSGKKIRGNLDIKYKLKVENTAKSGNLGLYFAD